MENFFIYKSKNIVLQERRDNSLYIPRYGNTVFSAYVSRIVENLSHRQYAISVRIYVYGADLWCGLSVRIYVATPSRCRLRIFVTEVCRSM